jgi:mannose-6-phosphate isomerase-like protein (cupin superfamily)
MTNFKLKQIEEMQALHHGAVKLAAAELGVESFGMQVLDLPGGFDQYPEHDHSQDGMEEAYVVLSGSAQFEIDGERVPIDETRMLWIAPEAKRKLEPGPDGVRVLAIGCTPGKLYQRPDSFRLAGQS